MAIELELSSLNLVATVSGLFLILYGSFSYLIKERLFLGEAPLAVLVGILFGPYGVAGRLGLAEKFDDLDQVALGLSRVVIGIQLVLVGVQLPYKYPWVEIKSLMVLLLPVMTTMWLATTLCIWLAIPDLPLLVGLVLSTGATPTDPVLSNAIVKGAFADQYVSPRIRNLISGESGANDGFGYPFLYLAVHLLKISSTTEALSTWVLETCLYTVGGSVIYGAIVGYVCRKALEFSTDRNWIDKESFLLYGAAMGLFIVGSGGALQIDDLLAAFVAGNALSWTDFYREQCEESEVDNCLDLLLNIVFFMFLGATIPFDAFHAPEIGITVPRLVLMCVLVLVLRRLPAMLAFWRFVPTIHDVSEAAFIGYFAPIGAGAMFYMGVILDEFKPDDEASDHLRIRQLIKPITYALVISSLLCHSLAIPLVKLYFEWRGIESIKLEGESDVDEEEYEEGEETASEHLPSDSYRHSSVHRPEGERRYSRDMHEVPHTHRESMGAYHVDGSWDDHASWRVSTGHKLGPHHQLRRNSAGELVLDPAVYTAAYRRARNRGRDRDLESEGTSAYARSSVGYGSVSGITEPSSRASSRANTNDNDERQDLL